MSQGAIAVNGRFVTMSITGVQRCVRETLPYLAQLLGDRLVVLVPPERVVLGGQVEELLAEKPSRRWHGAGGHCWEQLVLPRLVERVGARALWSPCNWGPLAVRRQLLTVHDIGALTRPQLYTPAYRLFARAVTGPLVRRTAMIATSTDTLARELANVLGVEPDRLTVVPPGVGEPFASWPLDGPGRRRFCVLVGAHDLRKNARFLLDLWPEVHRRTGLELHLTRRSFATTRIAARRAEVAGVMEHIDPTDAELAELYAGALCLLWPSLYEGYGLPLLEAMAVGTPFLSTAVGAAHQLSVEPAQQLLPLEPSAWLARLEQWANGAAAALRRPSAVRARCLTWQRSAELINAALQRVLSR